MTFVRVVEEVSRADGATGWCLALIGEYGVFSGYLPPETAHEIDGSDQNVRTAGQLRAAGEARVVDGGYRVTGRWQLGSGCQHANWIVGGCRIMDGAEPRLRADGTPFSRILFFPAETCEIIDTWDSIGLRGTGSHDYSVTDVFVPAARSLSFREPPVEPGPLYAMPTTGLLCSALAAVSLGIARHATDILLELAQTRTISRSRGGGLRDDAMVQASLGQAEALLRSGRAFLYKTLEEAWRAVSAGRTLTVAERASSGLHRHTRRIRPNRRRSSYSVWAVLPRCMRASDSNAACATFTLRPTYLCSTRQLPAGWAGLPGVRYGGKPAAVC